MINWIADRYNQIHEERRRQGVIALTEAILRSKLRATF